jgi:ATP-dependent DNA ligase
MLTLINPVPRADPFDHGAWLFELKFDGFRLPPTPSPGIVLNEHYVGDGDIV